MRCENSQVENNRKRMNLPEQTIADLSLWDDSWTIMDDSWNIIGEGSREPENQLCESTEDDLSFLNNPDLVKEIEVSLHV